MSLLTRLFQTHAASTSRVLANTDVRLKLRDDFPMVAFVNGSKNNFTTMWLKDTLDRQLDKVGETLDSVDHITIAYPHKAASAWKKKPHAMVSLTAQFAAALRKDMPQVNWIIADGLCETRHLNRSNPKGQDMVKTLRKKHQFDYIANEQMGDLPFVRKDHQGPSYFILLDDVYAQGTTAANMISFIHHNGGHVLAAASIEKPHEMNSFHLRQYACKTDKARVFQNDAYNKGAIPQIAEILSGYVWCGSEAGTKRQFIDDHLEDYVQELDHALQNAGLSLSTLTMAECDRLMDYFKGGYHSKTLGHREFIAALTQKPRVEIRR
ncbi:hypothetical protein [Micavibrio aeruginosavorus]|uniref:hypothetical protein n=1 Tax=Micavibrio aeruginosavorus TaxID=349221 RepID=UPI003F4AED04